MNTSRHRFIAIALAPLLLLTAARAEIKNFTFRGTVTSLADGAFVLDSSITNGATFEGFYIFETSALDSNPDTTVGDYQYTNSALGIVVKVGNYVFRTNPQHVDFLIEVVNRPDGDNYLLRSYNNVCSQPLMVDHIAWQLDDPAGLALTNQALPLVTPTLGNWQSVFGLTISGGCNSFFLRGNVSSVAEAPAVIPDRPAVSVRDAVEVKWPSRLGYFYQLQSSEDAKTWTNVGEPILGDGTELSRFFPRQHGKPTLFRVEIANFHK